MNLRGSVSAPLRVAVGILLVLHGLSHAVFAMRGSASLQPTAPAGNALMIAYSLALLFFVAAGIGIIGSRVLFPYHVPLLSVAVSLSAVSIALGWQADLWHGALIDLLVIVYLLVQRQPLLLPPRTAPSLIGRAGEALALLFVIYVGLGAVLWPWHRAWGTSVAEWQMALPGDPEERVLASEVMHGIAIDAPDWVVWTVLQQVVGERADWNVAETHPCRALVVDAGGTFAIIPEDDFRSRLVTRWRIGHRHAPAWGAGLSFLAFELPHFISERGMLRDIKTRAETPSAQLGASRCP